MYKDTQSKHTIPTPLPLTRPNLDWRGRWQPTFAPIDYLDINVKMFEIALAEFAMRLPTWRGTFVFSFYYVQVALTFIIETLAVVDNKGMFMLFLSCVFVNWGGNFLCLGGGALLCQGFSALNICPFNVYKKTEQIISIYAGFLMSSGRILFDCYKLRVVQNGFRFHQYVPLFVLLRPLNPAVLQRSWKATNLCVNWKKKQSFNCSATATKCPNS